MVAGIGPRHLFDGGRGVEPFGAQLLARQVERRRQQLQGAHVEDQLFGATLRLGVRRTDAGRRRRRGTVGAGGGGGGGGGGR